MVGRAPTVLTPCYCPHRLATGTFFGLQSYFTFAGPAKFGGRNVSPGFEIDFSFITARFCYFGASFSQYGLILACSRAC
jgi:hypothetical protein